MGDKEGLNGSTTVRARALESITQALVGGFLEIKPTMIDVLLRDWQSQVQLSIATPLPLDLLPTPTQPATVFTIGQQIRQVLADGFEPLTGHELGKVDLTFTGVHTPPKPGRVL